MISKLDENDFKTAIGVKLIKFKRMTKTEYCAIICRFVVSNEEEGYLVKYPDGYTTWSPKTVFESTYYEIENSNRITRADVLKFISKVKPIKIDDKTTLVSATTIVGYTHHETSSCVDPLEYNHDLGYKYALDKIIDKVWESLGFLLQFAKFGIKRNDGEVVNLLCDNGTDSVK